MPAPVIRLDDAARSNAAQIYIRGTQQLQLPGIWKESLQPQEYLIACSLNMTACHAAYTSFRDAPTPHRTMCARMLHKDIYCHLPHAGFDMATLTIKTRFPNPWEFRAS
jgi:hypothetical protein